jgi:NTE family protein
MAGIESSPSKNIFPSPLTGEGRVGVVFSSGFFGFFSHAGFLAALRELEIEPAGYAGSSSGAIVAAMAASGMRDPVIQEVLFHLKKSDFWDPDPIPFILKQAFRLFKGYTGYLKGKGFRRLLEQIPAKTIENCSRPLIIAATNLTQMREELFTRGNLIKGLQASGAVPVLFKPVEINGALYVDGGMVNKAPVQALADLIQPEKIIVHFIASDNLEVPWNSFVNKRMTPWHIYQLAVNISRQEAYKRQCSLVEERGIEIIEVRTETPTVRPDNLEKGPSAYNKAREETLRILENFA